MDETQQQQTTSQHGVFPRRWRLLVIVVLCSGVLSQVGCSLFVMAGKAIFGDPKVPSAFRTATGTNLAKSKRKVLVTCTTPESIKIEFPSLDFDLLEGVAQILKGRGVRIVSPDDVATWMDDHGGFDEGDLAAVAEHFDADFVVSINLERFTYQEENSPTLFRGRVNGEITAFEVTTSKGGAASGQQVFVRAYTSVYPAFRPVSAENMSPKIFQKKYVDRVSAQIAELFYDHRLSEEIQ